MNRILLVYPSFSSDSPMADIYQETDLENKVIPIGLVGVRAFLK